MTKLEATETLIELLKIADMRAVGAACANNPAFMEGFINALPKENRLIPADILPSELCGKQVRMLLGGISDRTLNRYRKKYPEMIVVGTVGPFNEGTDYVEGWKLADKLGIPMVDEHYYQTPGWFLNNQDFYDKYDRSKKTKVYLGEYATHIPGRKANIETALTEALYLAALERNGDVVHMTSYAPLLAKEGHTQWNPDLIYFNNREVKPTTGYYVQKLYGQNAGNEYLPSKITLDNRDDLVRKLIASSIVRDSASGDVIVKLVNLLSVEVNTNVDLSGIGAIQSSAKRTVLTGKPTDTPLPVEDTMEVAEKFDYQLPAYSFTVIRIKKANEK